MSKGYGYQVAFVEEQMEKYRRGKDSKLCYIVDKEFSISLVPEKIDVVVSYAAFEHFDDIERTITEVSNKIKKGGILIIHVDMNTHRDGLGIETL